MIMIEDIEDNVIPDTRFSGYNLDDLLNMPHLNDWNSNPHDNKNVLFDKTIIIY